MPNLSVGDVVLVNDGTPRGQWPMARIVEVHPDKEGVVRVVSIRMRGRIFARLVHKLCLLEQV
ncbi:hypothetical protein CAPTEDRAFT_143021 [Capitella teleta]|uniref:DUF5641 domain-containing protein n=1 Tax=Capitella teleta TaxID=283909 RepID=R7TSC9_CAPTE|nr:hypothetical protein CAPTEDRAFT_143021 [Capitella teleta]|eukprot:ELT96512.1 hypothetical protein CAPTEDRAFT_143021 [Capitella teleta]